MIDLTLRFWSPDVLLGPLVAGIGSLQHLYVAGRPMGTEGQLAGRIADRHYACTMGVLVAGDEEVLAWLTRVLGEIEAMPDLVAGLQSGRVEGLAWIARMYEDSPIAMPTIGAAIVETARRIGLTIFLENYTDFDEGGIPRKHWLPEA